MSTYQIRKYIHSFSYRKCSGIHTSKILVFRCRAACGTLTQLKFCPQTPRPPPHLHKCLTGFCLYEYHHCLGAHSFYLDEYHYFLGADNFFLYEYHHCLGADSFYLYKYHHCLGADSFYLYEYHHCL